ncbi:hypothetical protein E4U42_006426 [Claviceps africana]|uniref:Uncharacterized protein n=1 Tax=Claviceps africana TaxID=83212 RepID=A0A8K0NFR2_9HYPO|nr:hypothetical protein E4U42_006426 [Claviceps africana]
MTHAVGSARSTGRFKGKTPRHPANGKGAAGGSSAQTLPSLGKNGTLPTRLAALC